MNLNEIKIPEGWYILDKKQVLTSADKFYSSVNNDWILTTRAGEGTYTEDIYIRKITNPSMNNYQYKVETIAKTAAVLAYLDNLGYARCSHGPEHYHKEYPYIQISTTENKVNAYSCVASTPANLVNISFEEIFKLIPPAFVPVHVKLNDKYTAVIAQDGSFEVGCQKFTADTAVRLCNAINKVLSK